MLRSIRLTSVTMVSHGLIRVLVLIAIGRFSYRFALASDVTRRCNGICGGLTLPYPFGFSIDCPICFNCFEDGLAKIGDFPVQNVMDDSIFVGFPHDCNRKIEKMKPLFGEYYAPTSENSFLMKNCSSQWVDSCLIKQKFLESMVKLRSCDSSGNISCFSLDTNMNTAKFFKMENFTQSSCRSFFSSFAFKADGFSDGIELEFGRVRLGWWLKGDCRNRTCLENAKCTDVVTPYGKAGHRCSCPEGYKGDGLIDPCHRAPSDCHGSRFVHGRCRGSKVGIIMGGTGVGVSLITGIALLLFCVRRRSASLRSLLSAKRLLCEAAGGSNVAFLPYKEIEKATNGFSETQRLGTGAYGTVYAGKLQNDEWVAIKRLRQKDSDSIDQVMNEIKLLSSVSHPNLVRLLGCCIEQGEPVLVYEFMANGTLSQHLQRERGSGLPWTVRLNVATQTAKAIAFLHSTMNPPIYHRDIKSSNILLDFDFNSKVADFGLSRLGMTESSHISTAPQGTPGYLDPQYHQCFHLSDKSDVYSFGVVLVEIITALKVVDFNRPHTEINLAVLAISKIGSGCINEIIDPILEPNLDAWTLSSIHSVAEFAFRCLAFHRDMRPTMTEVADELEQIQLSAWSPNKGINSPVASNHGHGKSSNHLSVGGRRVASVPQKPATYLSSVEENSLLGNIPL